MKKAIITGATGFLGASLCKELICKGIDVVAVIRDERHVDRLPISNLIETVCCEISNIADLPKLIKDNDMQECVFYHLAWEGANGAARANYNIQIPNVKGTLDCAVAAKEIGCKKIVAVGTTSEYLAENAIENGVRSENLLYGMAKSMAHRMLAIQSQIINLPFNWCSFTNIFGPGDYTPNLVNYTIKTLLKNEVPSYSGATQLFDFVYVEDCARALYELGIADVDNQSYIFSSGQARPLKDFLYEIRDVVNPEMSIGLGVRPNDGTFYLKEWFDNSKFIRDISYKPETNFSDAIRKTVEWILS